MCMLPQKRSSSSKLLVPVSQTMRTGVCFTLHPPLLPSSFFAVDSFGVIVPFRRLINASRKCTPCVCVRCTQFACIGYGEVYPLWALSTVARGGLDWTTKQIGQVRLSVHIETTRAFSRVFLSFTDHLFVPPHACPRLSVSCCCCLSARPFPFAVLCARLRSFFFCLFVGPPHLVVVRVEAVY